MQVARHLALRVVQLLHGRHGGLLVQIGAQQQAGVPLQRPHLRQGVGLIQQAEAAQLAFGALLVQVEGLVFGVALHVLQGQIRHVEHPQGIAVDIGIELQRPLPVVAGFQAVDGQGRRLGKIGLAGDHLKDALADGQAVVQRAL